MQRRKHARRFDLKKTDSVMEETVYLWDHETGGVELYAASIGEFIENEKE